MCRSIQRLKIPPLSLTTHEHLTFIRAKGGGEFEPCLGKIGNLNRKCHVFPEEYSSFIFDMEMFKEKEFPLASWWLRSKRLQGLNFKAWIVKSVAGKWVESHGRCSCLLKNNWPSNSALGWGILTQFWFRGREFERTNFQMPRGSPGVGRC